MADFDFPVFRKTKIIATIGPSIFDYKMLEKAILNGADLFRINFSHSNYTEAEKVIVDIRNLAAEMDRHIGIFMDLKGPKMRIGKFKEGPIVLKEGDPFTITIEEITGGQAKVSTTYRELARDANKKDVILLDDGRIRLEVTDRDEKNVYTRVLTGGKLSDSKGMNLPGMKLSTPSLTDKDKADILFGIKHDIDYFALSFVRKPEDILAMKEFLKQHKSSIPVIAKIEKPEALERLGEIVDAADAIMVARGDLGVEMPMEKVPSAQKDIIRKTNFGGKPVIVATQMLESMINNPSPTRAEVSDVATAIFDWTDAVMLSGETAVGKYPLDSLSYMARIAVEQDKDQSLRKKNLKTRKTHFLKEESILSSLCDSADELADEISAKAIITFTESGRTALMLSKYRSSVPIIAISDKIRTCQKMTLFRGTWPVLSSRLFPEMKNIAEMITEAEERSKGIGLIQKGDLVVIMAGIPIAREGSTNMIRVHRIGEPF
ncbi:MAG: pyruvate kinase [bacterium]|nr:pyruvate kinase [bacterium]